MHTDARALRVKIKPFCALFVFIIDFGFNSKQISYSDNLKRDLLLRPSDEPQENTCEPRPSEITIMGYSMQTSRFHYTEWIQYDHETQKGNWSNKHARELYIDPRDDLNVASLPDLSDLVQELSDQLRKGWRNALPENNHVNA